MMMMIQKSTTRSLIAMNEKSIGPNFRDMENTLKIRSHNSRLAGKLGWGSSDGVLCSLGVIRTNVRVETKLPVDGEKLVPDLFFEWIFLGPECVAVLV